MPVLPFLNYRIDFSLSSATILLYEQEDLMENNKLVLDFHVIVAYGVSISTVCENLVGNVKYRVEEFTGMEVDKINVYVEGVRVID